MLGPTDFSEIYKINKIKKKVTFSDIVKVYKTYSNEQYNRKEYILTYKEKIMKIANNYNLF